MEREKSRSRKKKVLGVKFWATIGCIAIFTIGAVAAIIYMQIGKQYRTVFFQNTTINGINASKKTIDQVKQQISSGIEAYTLVVEERDGQTENIEGSAIGLESIFDGSLEKLLADQRPMDWYKHGRTPQNFEIDTMIQYDEAKLSEIISGLKCFDESLIVQPKDAHISDYVSGRGYSIVPAVEGTVLNREKTESGITEAIMMLKDRISLEELEAYTAPTVASDDPTLAAGISELNKYVNVSVTHTFGDKREVLNGDTISGWIHIGGDGKVSLNSGSVTEYVKSLASKYDTYNKTKTLKTSYGKTIQVKGGSYGWKMDQAAEAGELEAIIRSGESQTREPIYKQKAVSHGDNDYGDTYVEINLTAQHLNFYKNGSLVVQSDFVSGNQARGWATPTGVYPLTYKQKNAVLKGENYKTPVDFWMPFNGGVGMHDAIWRSSFGGSIYKTGGSHGCINLPHGVAQKIYENISSGMPILCYQLEGTESKSTSTASGTAQPTTAAQETTAAPTTAAPTTPPKETTAAAPTTAVVPTAPSTVGAPTTAASTGAEKGPGISTESSDEKEIGPGM